MRLFPPNRNFPESCSARFTLPVARSERFNLLNLVLTLQRVACSAAAKRKLNTTVLLPAKQNHSNTFDCLALQNYHMTFLAGGKRQDGGSRPVSQCAMDDDAASGAERKGEQPLKRKSRMRRFRNSVADFFGASKTK